MFRPMLPLDNKWQRYRVGPFRLPTERIHATIGPKHRILLNAKLYSLIGSPTEVVLYFHEDVNKIAIEPAAEGTPDTFPVINRRGSFEIAAASFCRHFHIRVRSTHKFNHPHITAASRLFLDLKNTTPITRRRNPPKPSSDGSS